MSIAPEQFLLLGGAILLGALLVLGGALIGVRSRRRGTDESEDPSATAPTEAPPSKDVSEALPTKREPSKWLSEWQRKLPPDVIVVSRDAESGEWLVEIEGQRYRRLSDIHDDKAATKIASALEGLRVFAGIGTSKPSESAPSLPFAASPALAESETPLPPPSGPRKLRQATYPAPEGSIIAQIETILQRELALRPELAHRTIHMGALPDGSLVIEVDVSFYRAPDEIPDPRVRDVVMLAVRTWEKSS